MTANKAIHRNRLRVAPSMDPLAARLPGLQPLAEGDWLRVNEAYAAQAAYRDALIAMRRDEVVMRADGAVAAEGALLSRVVRAVLGLPGFSRVTGGIGRLDGDVVELEADTNPVVTAARLAQEDFPVLEQAPEGRRLVSGALCFPASWSLGQKT